ncbi:MAG: hypothetical protein JO117_07945 [Verrucomicrobia bacterium]|nr:hypothetical protein [Verrucomicrobiota bacterium]
MSELRLYDFELPISLADMERLQVMLREMGIFCTCPTDIDRYNWQTYGMAAAEHNTDTRAFFDRNVFSDVVSLARSSDLDEAPASIERGRMGAAVMAFLQCCNIMIEPSLALYEEPAGANQDLRLFRRADEVDARIYTEIAFGRLDRIPRGQLPPPKIEPQPIDFARAIKGARIHRIAVLKIAQLELSNLRPLTKLKQFLDWVFHDFVFLPAAITLAAQQFAPSRGKPLLRHLRSLDRQQALRGIQNAVWDLLVAMSWSEEVLKQKQEKRFWLLCSRDESLKQLASKLLFIPVQGESREVALRRIYSELWGQELGRALSSEVMSLITDKDSPRRKCNQSEPDFEQHIDALEIELEQRVLDWRPQSKGHS